MFIHNPRDATTFVVLSILAVAALGPVTAFAQSSSAASPGTTAPESPAPSSMSVLPGELWIASEWVTPEAHDQNGVGIRLVRPDGSGDHWAEPNAPIGGGTDAGVGWQVVPDWSPDGNRLAFGIDHPDPDGTRDIWISDADGSNARVAYDCVTPCLATNHPTWSNDGGSLLFVAWDHVNNAVDGSRLELLDVATGTVRTVARTTGGDYFMYPRFSPDDRRVVAQIDHWSGIDDSSVFVSSGIAVVDLSVTPATITPIADSSLGANYPDWHPTDDRIVFTAAHQPAVANVSDLYTIRSDGTGEQMLLHVDGKGLAEPSWLPDGSGVIFNETTGGNYQDPLMMQVRADGTGLASATSDQPHLGSHPRMRPVPSN
jgi:Tol biopolymer transport system component